jgi:D-amino peptidase
MSTASRARRSPSRRRPKRVYILTDLEGVAGVTSFEHETFPDGRYYDRSQRLLTAEVNAAVEGVLGAGVEDVLVADGHGPGAIWFEDLHPDARLIHGRPITIHQLLDPLKDCDAAIIVGQHAMAGVATGNMNHTESSQHIDFIKVNGQPVGEIAMFALYAGAFGVPLIFLSGEADACREAEALIPGITTTAVKQGLGRGSAITVSAAKSREAIREGARRAVRHHAKRPVAPLVWPGPFTVEKRFFATDTADRHAAQFGVERVDSQTVRVRGDSIVDVIYR